MRAARHETREWAREALIKSEVESRLDEREYRGAACDELSRVEFITINEHRRHLPFVQDRPRSDLIRASLGCFLELAVVFPADMIEGHPE